MISELKCLIAQASGEKREATCVWIGSVIMPLMVVSVAAAAQDIVPIKRTILSNGAGRYSIPMDIDGQKLDVMLDTGSVGLRYLDLRGKSHGEIQTFSYGSGVVFHGSVLARKIMIGSNVVEVPAQDVIKLSCVHEQPICPANTLSIDQYRIGGSGLPNEGFGAIIGVAPNQGNDGWINPLASIGSSWIIELPLPHSDSQGQLVVDPPAKDQSKYAVAQKPAGAAKFGQSFRASVEGCVTAEGIKPQCGPISFDTGAVGVVVSGQGATALTGKDVQIHIHLADKSELTFSSDKIAQGAPAGKVVGKEAKNTVIAAGVLPYFAFSVLYDAKRDQLAIKPR